MMLRCSDCGLVYEGPGVCPDCGVRAVLDFRTRKVHTYEVGRRLVIEEVDALAHPLEDCCRDCEEEL